MKKTLSIICLVLTLAVLLSAVCFADSGNYDTLADWNLKVAVPEGATAALKGNCYYIYAQKPGYIPYVMITVYNYDSAEKFISDFTAYMQKQYPDLKVSAEASEKVIGKRTCTEIDYTYSLSGYEVQDRRIVLVYDGIIYMFASKEIERRGETVGNMLEEVISGCVFLNEEQEEFIVEEDVLDSEEPAETEAVPEAEEPSGEDLSAEPKDIEVAADAYIYTQKDGMLKYWLDFSDSTADGFVLHCSFRSGEPAWYETSYILVPDKADAGKHTVNISKVTDPEGNDCTSWFKSLKLRIYEDYVSLVVKRDKKTLAGGGDDNILTGTYRMQPVNLEKNYQYRDDTGMLKYWLEFEEEEIKLHAMFISGDPEYYEEVFTLDTKTAEKDGDYTLIINNVCRADGEDVSSWFTSLTLTEVQGAWIMNVERDEATLAGGAGDNILTGTYMFEPNTVLMPFEEGPYTPEELTQWARIRYFSETGYYPAGAETVENPDGTVTIELFAFVEAGDIPAHNAVFASYTVDAEGVGTDAVTGDAVSFFG